MENFQNFEENDTKFRHPFTMTISGSTGSGKSEWVMRLLKNLGSLVSGQIEQILYCYGELNGNVINLQKMGNMGEARVVVHAGVPSEEQIKERAKQTGGKLLMVLDDLMVGMGQQFLDSVFTRGSHNWGVSIVLVTQHLFSKELRIARNNSHYLVLMRNPAGALQIRTLATQLFPARSQYFMESYKDATDKNFGYLVIDMHPQSSEILRLKTHIFSEPVTIYVPK